MATALVTGATGDIGKAICKALAKDGFNLALHYHSSQEKALEFSKELENEYQIKVEIYQADFCVQDEISDMAKKVIDDFKRVDVLVNNAGMSHIGMFQLTDENLAEKIYRVNFEGAMLLTKRILPSMIENQKGRVINISSMWGISGASCEVHYSASKSALIGFTKALAKEEGPSGITVNCVAPGFIDTKMNSHLEKTAVREIIDSTPLCRAGKAEDVAELVAFLSKDKSSFITGQVISVDGGYCL